MPSRTPRYRWIVFYLMLYTLGCQRPAVQVAVKSTDEDSVNQVVSAVQDALKSRDAAKIWQLLDSDSQADAQRVAQAIRTAYSRATPAEKTGQEEALGLSAAELASLTGQSFLSTNRFLGKYHEIPDSKIDKVTIQGDKAIVQYTEADGDKEKLTLVKEDGKWKLVLAMPR